MKLIVVGVSWTLHMQLYATSERGNLREICALQHLAEEMWTLQRLHASAPKAAGPSDGSCIRTVWSAGSRHSGSCRPCGRMRDALPRVALLDY